MLNRLPVQHVTRAHVRRFLNTRISTPSGREDVLKKLRVLFRAAIDLGWCTHDPTDGLHFQIGSHRVGWSTDELAAFEAHWPVGTRERLAFDLLRRSGLRGHRIVTFTVADLAQWNLPTRPPKPSAPPPADRHMRFGLCADNRAWRAVLGGRVRKVRGRSHCSRRSATTLRRRQPAFVAFTHWWWPVTTWLRVTEIAQRTNLSRRYWQHCFARGDVPGARQVQFGRRRLFLAERRQFEAWWAQRMLIIPQQQHRSETEPASAGETIDGRPTGVAPQPSAPTAIRQSKNRGAQKSGHVRSHSSATLGDPRQQKFVFDCERPSKLCAAPSDREET